MRDFLCRAERGQEVSWLEGTQVAVEGTWQSIAHSGVGEEGEAQGAGGQEAEKGGRRRRGRGGQGGRRAGRVQEEEDGAGGMERKERAQGGWRARASPDPRRVPGLKTTAASAAQQGCPCHFSEPAPDPGKRRVQRSHAAHDL